MSILDILKKKSEKEDDMKVEQRRRHIQKILDEKAKSNNQRVLEKMIEEDRQKMITVKVKEMQKKRNDELFSGGMGKEKNMFLGHKNILNEDKKILHNKSGMIQRGNMFFN